MPWEFSKLNGYVWTTRSLSACSIVGRSVRPPTVLYIASSRSHASLRKLMYIPGGLLVRLLECWKQVEKNQRWRNDWLASCVIACRGVLYTRGKVIPPSTLHAPVCKSEMGKNQNPARTNRTRTQVLPRTEPNMNPNVMFLTGFVH